MSQTPGTLLGREFLDLASELPKYQGLDLFSVGKRPAFGITQCFTTGKDVPYQAISSVSKATYSICKSESDYNVPYVCDLIFRFVIILAPLFESFYDNEVKLNEIGSGIMTWRNPIVMQPHSIIKVQRFDTFKLMLPKYSEDIDTIFDGLKENDLLQKAKKNFISRNIYGVH